MIKKLNVIIIIPIGLFIFINLIIINSQAESGAPPDIGGESTGDWFIRNDDIIIRENQEIILKGNLTIQKNGYLTFKNVTLVMNCSFDGEYSISVEESGNFYIYDFDENSTTKFDSSLITAFDEEFEYGFVVEKDSEFIMKNSYLHECGDNTTSKGLTIKSDNVLIENNIITYNYYGIYCFSGSSEPSIYNNTISNNYYGIYCYMGATPKINRNEISYNDFGILCSWKIDIEIIGCTIFDNKNYGVSIKDCDVNLLDCNLSGNDIDIQCSRSEPKFVNCTLDSKEYDFYFERDTQATSLNTTFNENKIFFKNSDLTVQWYLNVKSIDQNGRPISDVIVQVQGNDSTFENFYRTDRDGFVKYIVCTEYSMSKNDKLYYTPHLVTVVREKNNEDPEVEQFFENINFTKTIYIEYITVNISIFCDDDLHFVKRGQSTSYSITLVNNGDFTETITLQLFSIHMYAANLSKNEINLTAGESLTINLLTFTVPENAADGTEYVVKVIALVGDEFVGDVETYTMAQGGGGGEGRDFSQVYVYFCAIIVLCIIFYVALFIIGRLKK